MSVTDCLFITFTERDSSDACVPVLTDPKFLLILPENPVGGRTASFYRTRKEMPVSLVRALNAGLIDRIHLDWTEEDWNALMFSEAIVNVEATTDGALVVSQLAGDQVDVTEPHMNSIEYRVPVSTE